MLDCCPIFPLVAFLTWMITKRGKGFGQDSWIGIFLPHPPSLGFRRTLGRGRPSPLHRAQQSLRRLPQTRTPPRLGSLPSPQSSASAYGHKVRRPTRPWAAPRGTDLSLGQDPGPLSIRPGPRPSLHIPSSLRRPLSWPGPRPSLHTARTPAFSSHPPLSPSPRGSRAPAQGIRPTRAPH